MRGQESGAGESFAGGAYHATAGVRSGILSALGQAQQGESRLWFEARAARLAIGRFSQRELATQTMNLRLLIVSAARCVTFDGAHATLNCTPGLIRRFEPRTIHLEDFRAMHETVAGKHAELWVRCAPARQCGSPFPHPFEREYAMTARNRGAVDDASDHWRQFTARGRHHGFVQELQAAPDLPGGQQSASLQVTPESNQVGLREALADPHRPGCAVVRLDKLPCAQMPLGGR